MSSFQTQEQKYLQELCIRLSELKIAAFNSWALKEKKTYFSKRVLIWSPKANPNLG